MVRGERRREMPTSGCKCCVRVCESCGKCGDCCECSYCEGCDNWTDGGWCGECDRCSSCCECLICDNCSERFGSEDEEFCRECDRCGECCECEGEEEEEEEVVCDVCGEGGIRGFTQNHRHSGCCLCRDATIIRHFWCCEEHNTSETLRKKAKGEKVKGSDVLLGELEDPA